MRRQKSFSHKLLTINRAEWFPRNQWISHDNEWCILNELQKSETKKNLEAIHTVK